jgi:tetratricopeptide (TPR) repeat protein
MGALASRKWRDSLLASLGVVLALALLAVWHFRNRPPVPEPPLPDLAEVDPAVAQAVETARAPVRQSPRSADAWGHLGQVLLAHAFDGEARTCFAVAEQLAPREPRWPYYQGITLALDNPEAAIARFQRALELGGEASGANRLRLAELLQTVGRLDEAEEQFRLLARSDPANPRAALGLAQIAYEQGGPERSLTHLRRAVNSPFTRKRANQLLARISQQQGDRAAAGMALHRAEDLPDDLPCVDAYLGEAEQLRVGRRIQLEQADGLVAQGRPGEAVAILQQAARDFPNAEAVWVSLGKALMAQGDVPAAEHALRRAVQLAPEAAEARFQLGVALFRAAAYPAAAECFRKAADLKPAFALAYYNLGHCLQQQGDRPAAIQAFQDAVRYRPHFQEAYVNLADLLAQEGRTAEACEHVRHALRLNPADERARQLLENLK